MHNSPDSADIANKTAETFETSEAEHFPQHSGSFRGLVEAQENNKHGTRKLDIVFTDSSSSINIGRAVPIWY